MRNLKSYQTTRFYGKFADFNIFNREKLHSFLLKCFPIVLKDSSNENN